MSCLYPAKIRILFLNIYIWFSAGSIKMKSNNFVQKVADKITDLGLIGPAILLLEANKPLAFLGSQLLLVAQPTLNIFVPPSLTQQTINLLADSTQLEQLLQTLESGPAQSNPVQPETLVAEEAS